METQQFRQKLYHDRRSRIGQFLVGQKVWVREYKSIQSRWTKGCITEVLGSRTYLVRLEDGTIVRRHSDQLQKREEMGRVSDSASADDVNSDAYGWFEISNHQDQTEARGAPNIEMEQQEVGGEAPDGEQQEESLDDNQPPSQSSAITRRYPIRHRQPPDRPGFVSVY